MQNIMWHNGRGRERVKAREERLEERKKNIMWQFDGAICVLFGATRMF